MTTVPSELYRSPEIQDHAKRAIRLQMPDEAVLAVVDQICLADDIVGELDRMRDEDYSTWYDVKSTITRLPGEVIYQNFGEETLVWAVGKSTHKDNAEELADVLVQKEGYDKDLLFACVNLCFERNYIFSGKDLIGQYAVASAINEETLSKVDLPNIIKDTALPGVAITDKRIQVYSLLPLKTIKSDSAWNGPERNWYYDPGSEIQYKIWLDGPSGVALAYRGKPNAVMSFTSQDDDEMMIEQLQGIRPIKIDESDVNQETKLSSRGLAPLDWRITMLEVASHLARYMGKTNIGLISGDNVSWVHKILPGENKPHLDVEVARAAYDVVAERYGFVRGDDGSWHKQLI